MHNYVGRIGLQHTELDGEQYGQSTPEELKEREDILWTEKNFLTSRCSLAKK